MKFRFRKWSLCIVILAFSTVGLLAQTDPDPDSPVPILLSGPDTSRILAVDGNRWDGSSVPETGRPWFRVSRFTPIVIFVSNLDLMSDESRNAVRVYLTQRSGKTFELETTDLVEAGKGVYAIRLFIRDATGYRGQPVSDGDSLIYLTWRGLSSNVLKIGLGSTGGGIQIPIQSALINSSTSETSSEAVGYFHAGDRVRFLEQAAFGPTSALDFRIRRIGIRTWLAEQFDTPYPTFAYPNPPQMVTNNPTCTLATNPNCFREHYTMMPLQKWFFTEALYGNAQLRHRMAWTLGQIWVTSGVTIQQSSHAIAYHKILSQNAFGNYRTLMHDVTLNPAMGFYLDMVRSTKTNPNENYPREILQLFSIGLYMLNQDGTVQTDPQGAPIETYNQEDINQLSKVFTGWTFCNANCQNSSPGIVNFKDPMVLVPANHDLTAKTLPAYPGAQNPNIPACTGCTTDSQIRAYADASLNQALNHIFDHPNVGPFIGKLLIQHMVTSDPSPAYVSRVAAAFNNNGAGTRGDLKAVLRAILLDPEARGNLKTAPRYGKLREPVQFVTNIGRIFPARDFGGESISDGALASHVQPLGQNPFYSPTVFNYYSPEFIIPGTTVLAPEFEILNTGNAVKRTNLLHTLVFEGLTANATDSLRGTSLDYSEFVPAATADPTGNQLIHLLNTRMMHGSMTQLHREKILPAVLAVPSSNPLMRVKTAVYLLAASSQYQIQR
ncbi:MAG TPA: DUF1800 domain-containing protein [Pyrinomonadaceae bacterium]|nr:DUF1800 domain-containing protein [Pyrinomonadaceae bacterium]